MSVIGFEVLRPFRPTCLGASLKSAAIGGAIDARFAQMGMAARAASKAANVGKASSGLTSADDAAGLALRTLFKHDFIINPKTGLSTGIPRGLMSEGAESTIQRTIAVGFSRQNNALLVLKTALEYTVGGAATYGATEYARESILSEFSR